MIREAHGRAVSLVFDADTLRQLDEARGLVPRATYIRIVLLDHLEKLEELKEKNSDRRPVSSLVGVVPATPTQAAR